MENSNDDIRVFLSSPQSLDLIEKNKIKPKIKSKRKKRKVVSKKMLIKNILMEEDLSKLTERQKILNKKFRDNVKDLNDISLINSGIDIIPYDINNVTVLGRFMESKEDEEGENKRDDKDKRDDFLIKENTKKRKLSKEKRLGSIYYKKLYEDCLNGVKPENKRLCTIKLKNMTDIYKIQIPLGEKEDLYGNYERKGEDNKKENEVKGEIMEYKDLTLENEDGMALEYEQEERVYGEDKGLENEDIALENEDMTLENVDVALVNEDLPSGKEDIALENVNIALVNEDDLALENEDLVFVNDDLDLVNEDDRTLENEDRTFYNEDKILVNQGNHPILPDLMDNKDLPSENNLHLPFKIDNSSNILTIKEIKVPVSIEIIPLVKDFTKIRLKISKNPFLTNFNYILRIHIDLPSSLIYYPITLYPKNHLPFFHNFLLYKKEKEIYAKKCLFLSCLCKNMNNFSLKYEDLDLDNEDSILDLQQDDMILEDSILEDLDSFPDHTISSNLTNNQPSLSENKISCLMKISMYLELIQISLKIHKCEITGLLIEKLKIILEKINNSKCVCDIEERIMNVLTKADQCKKCKYEKMKGEMVGINEREGFNKMVDH